MSETARWTRVKDIFQEALDQPADQRSAFVARSCAGEGGLESEVKSLIDAHAAAGNFAERPAVDQSPGSVAHPSAASAPARGARHPFVRLVWLVAVLEFPVLLYGAWIVMRGDSDFGWTETRVRQDFQVAAVNADGPAAGLLSPGDRLISMNGDSNVAHAPTAHHRRGLEPGETYTLIIARAGQPREVQLIVGRQRARTLAWYLVSVVWCGVGLFMGFAGAHRPLARLAFVTATAVGHVFLQVGVIHAAYVFQPIHMALGYHFFYVFPGGVPASPFWGGAVWALYGGCVLPALVGHWLNWLYYSGGPAATTEWVAMHPTLTMVRQSVGLGVGTLASFGIVGVILRNYRLVTDPDRRRRVRWIVGSSIIGLLPQIWWALVADYNLALGPAPVALYSLFVNAMTLTVPLSVAYAVVRHRVLDVTVVIRRGVQYLLAKRGLELLLAVPTGVLVFAVVTNQEQTIGQLFERNTAAMFWIVALGLSVRFNAPLHAWLDRRFFREQCDREAVLLGLLNDLGRVDSPAELGQLAGAQLEYALHPKALYLWFRDGSAFVLGYASAPQSMPPAPAFDAYLTVPIADTDGRLTGVLMLAEKKSEEPYTASDRELLHAIAKQVGVVRENLRLQVLVGNEQRIRHEVLARLDRSVSVLRECPSCGACFDGSTERCDADGTTLMLSLPVERTIDGRYRLDRLIGRGGMGAVYEAFDLQLARHVAIKIMIGPAIGRDESIRRFQREARAAARLSHPSIVSVHDYGTAAQVAFLVMERVHGVTLRAELQRLGVMSGSVAAGWFDQILDGVGAAHARGVVHRDLKPENVIGERSRGGALAVKILDFGLAKLRPLDVGAPATHTISGVVVGTFGYMSPEQLLGRDVDERTDIFAIGVMVVEVVSGQRPFDGEGYYELLRAMLQDDYHLPGASRQARALDAVMQRCLAKHPQDRFASAAALRRELVPALRAFSFLDSPMPGDSQVFRGAGPVISR